MPGCNAAPTFFKQGLIVIKSHTIYLHQVGSDFGDALAKNQFFDQCIFGPQIKQLQKCFSVGGTIFKGCSNLIHFGNLGRYVFVKKLNGGFIKHMFQFDVLIFNVEIYLILRQGIRGIEDLFHGLAEHDFYLFIVGIIKLQH